MKYIFLFVSVYFISDLACSQNVIIDTYDVNSITKTSARTGGKIRDDGGSPVTARGVVYSTDSNPTVEVSAKTINGSGTGTFVSTLSGLSANTQYYVRSYATNSSGTSYGNTVGFTTADTLFMFNFYKDQSTDTTLLLTEVADIRTLVGVTNNLALPPGVFLYFEVDSVENLIKFTTAGSTRSLNSGDTVHIGTYDEGEIAAVFYTDSMGLDRFPRAIIKVKVGGKAQTTSSTYYCQWSLSGYTTNTTERSIYTTDSSFQCDFVSALPAKWISFGVRKPGQSVILNWSTGTEQNTKDFRIQYSTDGITWKTVAILAAIGNSGSPHHYIYEHNNTVKGYNYYRLMQTDLNGKITYSEMRGIKMSGDNAPFTVLGNVVSNGTLRVQVHQTTVFSLYGVDGKLLWLRQFSPGLQSINVSRNAKGIYLLKTEAKSQKILIQ